MICEDAIKAYLDTLQSGFHCRQSPNGRLSILTPYLYPDHDNIEVFVRPNEDRATVSDSGETLRGLDTLGLDVMHTPNAFFAARRIAEGFGVQIERGVLVKRGAVEGLGSLVFDVILACQSVSSLVYGSRAYEPVVFKKEVKDYLKEHGFSVEENVKETGVTGKKYTVSFRIPTRSHSFWVSAVSPKNSAAVQKKVNYNFRMWSDLQIPKEGKVNLLNDDLLSFKQEDIRILEKVSTIYRWTKRQDLVAALHGSPPVSTESHN